MKTYEVKRDGITILLSEPLEGDIVVAEYDVPEPLPDAEQIGLPDGDYTLHIENGAAEWRRMEAEENG